MEPFDAHAAGIASTGKSTPVSSDHETAALVRWWAIAVGSALVVLGLLLLGGGAWLIALGGSWYYIFAGAGLIASGWLLLRRQYVGVFVYLAVWLLTMIWAVWEVGFQLWPLVPRTVAPTVLLLFVITTAPALRRRRNHTLVAATMALLFSELIHPAPAVAQQPTSPAERAQIDQARPGPAVTGQSDTKQPIIPPQAGDGATGMPPGELKTGSDWPAYGGSYKAERYSPLNQITTDNVARLKRVWTYRSGDMPGKGAKGKYSPENTPIKVGDSLYFCTAKNILISLDAKTGKEEWRHDPEVSDDAIPYGATCRGVVYFSLPDAAPNALCAARIIQATLDARLIAVDADTGQPCVSFGRQGEVDLNRGIGDTVPGWYAVSSPPTLVKGILVTGAQVKDGQAEDAPSGVIRGYDAASGKLAWAWDMGKPDLTGVPAEGETYTRGTPNMWTIAAGDDELGLVYLPMGNSSVDYYAGNRSAAENEFSTALVAIDVTTGDVKWKFQTVHKDVWDYDLGSQPTLVDFPGPNGSVPAVVLASKQGPIYVLNRETGEPLFPVEERPAPTGGVEPEQLSKTQPYSTYATLSKPQLTEKDMWGMSPLDQLWCRIQFHRASYKGEYTPPTADRHWIQYPGYNGGSDWGSIAIDSKSGILIANYNDMPNYNRLIPRKEADDLGIKSIDEGGEGGGGEAGAQAGSPFAIDVNAGWRMPTGLLCKQPPYGHIRAIDLKTGKTLWDKPLGTARNNGPFGIPSLLPINIGTPNNGGPIITAGGLVFLAATTDDIFRAINIKTGEVVWQDTLPAGGQTTPITYEVDGRQYVVIAPGGHHFMETKIGDYVIAYALDPVS